jgi:hypothetical protein
MYKPNSPVGTTGVEQSASRYGRFTPRETALGYHRKGGWVDPRAGLNDVEKRKFLTLPGMELRPLVRPACSQSLHRLPITIIMIIIHSVVYSTTPSTSQTTQRQLAGRLVNNELERIWKELVVTYPLLSWNLPKEAEENHEYPQLC